MTASGSPDLQGVFGMTGQKEVQMKNSKTFKNSISGITKKSRYVITLVMTIITLMGVISMFELSTRAAGNKVSVEEIDYSSSTITVKMAAADTTLYISDSKQKKWECVPMAIDPSTKEIVLDISWISLTKDYALSLKGDYSSDPVKVIIPKQVTNFRASYNTATGLVTFTNAGSRTIEWKKRDALTWTTVPSDSNVFKDQLLSLCPNGAVVLFRLAPENGTSASKPGMRASKEVSCSISKKSASPAITVNDETLCIPVTKGMQYRFTNEDGNPISGTDMEGRSLENGAWADIKKTENLPIAKLAPVSIYTQSNTVTQDVYVQFRTMATSSKQISNNTTIHIPAQEPLTQSAIAGAKLEYTSSTTFEITISAAGPDNPYEYCVINTNDIKDGITIDSVEDLTWNTVNAATAVTVDGKAKGIKDNSLIYIRRKAVSQLGSDEYRLASPSHLLATIEYPGNVKATSDGKLKWIQTIAGICDTANVDGYIEFDLYSPSKQIVKEMKLVGFQNKENYGTVDIKSVVKENSAKTGSDDAYIITTTITSTSRIDQKAESESTRKMLAYFTFQNADKTSSSGTFESSEEDGGIALYLYPATKVNNPSGSTAKADSREIARILSLETGNDPSWSTYSPETDPIGFTSTIKRVYLSNRIYGENPDISLKDSDKNLFRVRLDFGTPSQPDLTGTNPPSLTETANKVVKLKYDGIEIPVDDYAEKTETSKCWVEYANTKVNNEARRVAILTIDASEIETMSGISARNTDSPLDIYLSNNEIVTGVTMNLVESATIDSKPISWSITENSLETTKNVTTNLSDGSNTTSTEKVTDFEFSLTVYDPTYAIVVNDVTWGGQSVLDTSSVTNGKINIKLSNEKLNSLSVGSSAESKNLVIVFNNGFTITTGATLTVTPKVGK